MFYPAALVEVARSNVQRYPWAAAVRDALVEAAAPWMAMSDDELWGLMFGNTIRRSWMVWSNGYCPACQQGVPMYNWKIDALRRPWKVQCPHCGQVFPKNDFLLYYRSGLDEHGIFDPSRADRSLLFNAEHPDPADPLHLFGVDDGEGYVEGDKRWRFIGAYLIYGQWKQVVLGGITRLAAAYVITGDRAYARKAAILLDRVADLYPSFDFRTQGVMYEGPAHAGYVSTWHDACEETRQLALAYDQIFDALDDDPELIPFLSARAAQYGLGNPKSSPADVRRNIEQGILFDALKNSHKIVSNYPRQEIALIIIKSVLGWPENREDVLAHVDAMIRQATSVDGVTGEKGLSGYAAYTIQSLAQFLAEWSRADPERLRDILDRHPVLHDTYRFFIDTWCLQQYYPLTGDAGSFAKRHDQYAGVVFRKLGESGANAEPLAPSMYTFLWRLYELTGDAAFVQALYRGNGDSLEGLPHDLFCEDPETIQEGVRQVLEREGTTPQVGSVNKQGWHLAILRSGKGEHARAAWLDYDAGGGHGHLDGLNLGLFALGLDLMPDFGYPPVHYGGWSGPRFSWYVGTLSHNTVVVDGKNQVPGAGKTTLWADGDEIRLIRASAPALIDGQQYERTVAMVDVSASDFYLVDVFRVVGGTDHAKFMLSHYGTITTHGLKLQPCEDYGHGSQMRNFQCDPSPQPGWWVDWAVEDRYQYLPPGTQVHLRYRDLTTRAEAYTAEAWVSPNDFRNYEEAWVPRVITRRRGLEAPLASTFVNTIEPYGSQPAVSRAERLPLFTPDGAQYADANVALEVWLADGRRDLFVVGDVENPLRQQPAWTSEAEMLQPEWGLSLQGEACFVRRAANGNVSRVALCRGSALTVGDVTVKLQPSTEYVEIAFESGHVVVVAGDKDAVQQVRVRGQHIYPQ